MLIVKLSKSKTKASLKISLQETVITSLGVDRDNEDSDMMMMTILKYGRFWFDGNQMELYFCSVIVFFKRSLTE